ncbi:MAG TPA: hypothetical protein VMC84_06435 [Methanocella sp.]|uniref:hypothetical protein n=1 Tax=Methanocella sp. TaxID=2052833 RepID=UPI002B5D1B4A|nr:hypothetical protein [Methanocella sp.]HTY90798.1 hypothetical protein [Methanocella sp.]
MRPSKPLRPGGEIRVKLEDKERGRLSFCLSFSACVVQYFNADRLFVNYDVDVGDVSESILAIPAIANVAPVAWAAGANVRVDELDSTFLSSLQKVRKVMEAMYPDFSTAGDIIAEHIVSNRFGGRSSAQLFTGGVDSLATYARHRDEKPELISLGLFKPYSEALQQSVYRAQEAFAQKEGVRLHRVESNLNYAFFNQKKLLEDHGQHLFERSWWAGVQHGLGLLGICAPLAAVGGTERVYIGSSMTKDQMQGPMRPWGSHPLIDGNVAWADVQAVHDGAEWSRQEKIRHEIKPFIEKTGNYPPIIVCDEPGRGDVLNCGRCEKCSRTIAGLALEGIDPNLCGLKVDNRTFCRIRQKLQWDRLMFAYKKSGMWKDIQSAIPATIEGDAYGSKEFFEWLRAYKFPDVWGKNKPFSQRLLQKCLKLGIIQ